MSCDVCAHADDTGAWPQDILNRGGTHCQGCHRTWLSTAQSHCAACHRHFGSDSAGDSHRFGDYRGGGEPVCRDPKGFDRWETPDGVIWGGRDPESMRERMRRVRASSTPPVSYEERTEHDFVEDSA